MKMNFTWPFNTSAKNSGGGFLEIDRNYGGVNYRIAICIIQVIICFTGLLGNCDSDNNMEDVSFAFIGECVAGMSCCIRPGCKFG